MSSAERWSVLSMLVSTNHQYHHPRYQRAVEVPATTAINHSMENPLPIEMWTCILFVKLYIPIEKTVAITALLTSMIEYTCNFIDAAFYIIINSILWGTSSNFMLHWIKPVFILTSNNSGVIKGIWLPKIPYEKTFSSLVIARTKFD